MSRRNVVSFYTAPARSGKTFLTVVKICDEIIPLTDGVIYTNLPLNVELIAGYCSEKYRIDSDAVLSRLHIIPREVELSWKDAGMPVYDISTNKKIGTNPLVGPWGYFSDKELSGSTIIIDEIHNFCGSIGTPKPISNLWQKWLGELGHNQAVFLCISQSPEKVHPCIKQEAQASYTIRNTGLDRDPYFKIEIYDWLELWSGLFGMEYKVFVFEQEIQKSEGKSRKGQRKLQLMGPPYFDFYDSFNKPIASEQTANLNAFEHEYEKHLRKGPLRGRLSLLWWFFFKNMQPLVSRGLFAALFLGGMIFLFNGGAGTISRYISRRMSGIVAGKSGSGSVSVSPPAESAASPASSVVGGSSPPPTDSERIESIRREYEGELRTALLENEKISSELERARDELRRQSVLVLVTPEKLVLKRGHEYALGEEISSGEYRGRKVSSINFRRREAFLDDGTVLGLVDDRVPVESKTGSPVGSVPTGVQPVLPTARRVAGSAASPR